MTTDRPWHDDDRFWEAFRDAMFPAERFADASDELDAILVLPGVDVATSDAVLDLPCGAGRHSVALTDRGFDVMSVDATATCLEEARSRAADRDGGDAVEFVQADMCEFDVSHGLYSAYELTELLANAGFDAVDGYGTLDGGTFDQNAERLLVVGQT